MTFHLTEDQATIQQLARDFYNTFSDADKDIGMLRINFTYPQGEQYRNVPLLGDVADYQPSDGLIGGGTDLGDVSYVVPTVHVLTATYANGTPGHSWQQVAQTSTSIAHKGMLFAAKSMALTLLEFLSDPQMLEQAKDELRRLEEEGVILGYQAVIDWDRVMREIVTALIEVKVTPQSLAGFDRIAERIYQYDEVESMYLMSGSFDLTVIISGRSLREVAQFVGERLAPLEGVTGTATHFILKKYKEKHLIFRPQEPQEREYIFV